MAFSSSWVETVPDGSVITVSQLDNYIRQYATAVRERLEGDPAAPDLTGLIEVGSWPTAPKPRKGTARAYVDTQANIVAFPSSKKEAGRLAISSDVGAGHPKLYHVDSTIKEFAYVPLDGSRSVQGNLLIGTTATDPACGLRVTGAIVLSTDEFGLFVDVTSSATVSGQFNAGRFQPHIGVATLVNVMGVRIRDTILDPGGAFNNQYGLWIDDQTKGTVTNYAIYTNAGLIRFGDAVHIFAGGLTVDADVVFNTPNFTQAVASGAVGLVFKSNSVVVFSVSGANTAGTITAQVDFSGSFSVNCNLGQRIFISVPGDVYAGNSGLANNSTAGFFRFATTSGIPTGVPIDAGDARLCLNYDRSNNKLYVYNGAWKSVTLT